MFPLAVVTSIVMLVVWFPLSTLWNQQSQLDATAAQIATITQQQQALTQQAKSISTQSAATLLARQEYQLVAPGQSLIQVLPGAEAGNVSSSAGDPGFAPLVSPSSVSSLVASTSTTHVTHSPSFFSRLLRTLEFWH